MPDGNGKMVLPLKCEKIADLGHGLFACYSGDAGVSKPGDARLKTIALQNEQYLPRSDCGPEAFLQHGVRFIYCESIQKSILGTMRKCSLEGMIND